MSDEIFDMIVHKVTVDKGLELAAYHPRFIVDQVIATCRFMREPPHFEPRFIDYAIDNLRVRQSTSKKVTQARIEHVTGRWSAGKRPCPVRSPGRSQRMRRGFA